MIQQNLFLNKVIFLISWAHPRLEVGHRGEENCEYQGSTSVIFSHSQDKTRERLEEMWQSFRCFSFLRPPLRFSKELLSPRSWASVCDVRGRVLQGTFFSATVESIHTYSSLKICLAWSGTGVGRSFQILYFVIWCVWTSQLLLSPGRFRFKHMLFLYLLIFCMLQSLCHPHGTALAVLCSSGLPTVTAKEPFPQSRKS